MATRKSQAYSHILSRIAKGTLAGGERISPMELGKEMGISHIPVREAISQLESEGFVVQSERQGAFVRELSREEFLHLFDLRIMLEQSSIGAAAERIGGNDLDSLQEYLIQLKDLTNQAETIENEQERMEILGQWMVTDLAFHIVLLHAAGNPEVVKVFSEKQVMLQMFINRGDAPEVWTDKIAYNHQNYEVHEKIFQAVKQRDPKAAQEAMAFHNERARENLVKQLDWLAKKESNQKLLSENFPKSMCHFVDSVQHHIMKGLKVDGQ